MSLSGKIAIGCVHWRPRRRCGARWVQAIASVVALLSLASMLRAGTFEILARMGDQLPDGNGKYGFYSLGVTDFNNAGQILVHADELVDTDLGGQDLGMNDDSALVLFSGSEARIIARENGGTGIGGKFASFNVNILNNDGEVAFSATLRDTPGGTADNVAIFRTNGNALLSVVQKGDATPHGGTFGLPQLNLGGFNDLENVVFTAVVSGGSTSRAIYEAGGGSFNMQRVAYDGEAVDPYGTLSFIGSATLDGGGYAAFPAFLQGTNATEGIFRGRGDNVVSMPPLAMVIADPTSVEQNAISDILFSPNEATVNGDGDVVFSARLINTADGSATDEALFVAGGGVEGFPSLVVQKGDRVPGGNGKYDGGFVGAVNDTEQVAFRSFLRDTISENDWQGLYFRDSNGLIEEIVRIGDALPGSSDSVSELDSFQLANTGDLVFQVTLEDGEANQSVGVYWWDGVEIAPILRSGDPFDGSTVSGNYNSIGWRLNDSQQLALSVDLTDGRSVLARFLRGNSEVTGDFNGDGSVDAADYVAWRKGFGTQYNPSHYEQWRAHFGQTIGSGFGTDGALDTVPEPAGLSLISLSLAALMTFRSRQGGSRGGILHPSLVLS